MLDADFSGRVTIRIGKVTTSFARATRLGPDLQRIVAREPADGGALLRRVMLVFLAGGALFMALVGGLGRLAAGRLHWRIERINDAFRDPEEGRLPPPGGSSKGDEIDELTAHSVAAIARQKQIGRAHV